MKEIHAYVRRRWNRCARASIAFDVVVDNELIVEGSRQPGPDACRALLARGVTGRLLMCDDRTGRRRYSVNIELGAQGRPSNQIHSPQNESAASTGKVENGAAIRKQCSNDESTPPSF